MLFQATCFQKAKREPEKPEKEVKENIGVY